MSGQLERADALRCIAEPIASPELVREDYQYVVKKLGLTREAFEEIMRQPRRSYRDFKNEADRYDRLKAIMRFAQARRLLPLQVGM
jgi:hypothetical protein